MTKTLIENGIALDAIAKTMKITVARVEAEAHELDVYIGVDWANRPAVSVTDAHGLVSGAARRDHVHAAAHRRWRTDGEAWESAREQVRQQAYGDTFDAARRRGVGDPAAAHAAALASSVAVEAYERKTPEPTFGGVETSSRLSQVKSRVKESVLR